LSATSLITPALLASVANSAPGVVIVVGDEGELIFQILPNFGDAGVTGIATRTFDPRLEPQYVDHRVSIPEDFVVEVFSNQSY